MFMKKMSVSMCCIVYYYSLSFIVHIIITDVDFVHEENVPITQKTICPKSVTGSRRHLRSLSLDALTTIAEYGAPTFFITLTCNIKWREIQERLINGQDAFDRPDIVMQVTCKCYEVLLNYG